jgi:hypothetical protein
MRRPSELQGRSLSYLPESCLTGLYFHRYAVDQYLGVGDWVISNTSNVMSRYPDFFTKKKE